MNYLKNFLYKDRKKTIEKIGSFLDSGSEKIHLVLDFDRTLTKGKDLTTWAIFGTHLSPEGIIEYKKAYNKYRPMEIKNKMKLSDAISWWEEMLTLYKENKVKWQDIMKDVKMKMSIRPGAKELFDICAKKNISTIIISAGTKNIIEALFKRLGIKPTLVLSTKLFFDSKGYMKGWDRASLIHVLNKKEMGHTQISKIRKSRPKTILIGDSIQDADMVSGEKNVLRIIVDDPRIDDASRGKAYYKDVFKKFDLIIKNKNLYPVVNIIKLLK
jgi:cytosolic 5'-nucleotidase 3